MIFNSLEFAVFLGLVLGIYWTVPPRLRNHVLLASSYVFYGWWDWRFLTLLAFSTVADFTIARRLHRTDGENQRKLFLWLSLSINLGVLGIFKYYDFFVGSAIDALAGIGLEPNPPLLNILLPVGISFYTFQTISYTFDVYRRQIEPTSSVVVFATYVAYFPQLVAGPIERARRLLPIIAEPTRRSFPVEARLTQAFSLILAGLFKKVVIADGVAPIVNEVFDSPGELSWIMVVVGVIAVSYTHLTLPTIYSV